MDALLKFNPHHEPAGSPTGGQFSATDGGGLPAQFHITDVPKGNLSIPLAAKLATEPATLKAIERATGYDARGLTGLIARGVPGEVELTSAVVNKTEERVELGWTISRPDGSQLGVLNRNWSMDGKSVYHDVFMLRSNDNAKGIGKQVMGNLMAIYQSTGVERIGVAAADKAGGYVWAKFGFVPTVASWATFRNINSAVKHAMAGLDDETHARVSAILADANPKAMWRLSDMTEPYYKSAADRETAGDRGAWSVGKRMLMGTVWDGTLSLKDPEAVARFNRYVGGASLKKAYSTTSGMLSESDLAYLLVEDREATTPDDLIKFNPNHAPSGSSIGGQFVGADGQGMMGFLTDSDSANASRAPINVLSPEAKQAFADDDLAEKLQDRTGYTPEQLTHELGKNVDARVRLDRATLNNDNLYLEWGLYNKTDATKFGEIERSFDTTGGVVHQNFFLNEEYQGKGLAKQLFRNLDGIYEHAGIDGIYVHAAGDKGGYVWAKFGFTPSPSDWKELQYTLEHYSNDSRLSPAVQKAIASNDPRGIWKVADSPLGKELLMGGDWTGMLYRSDPEAMDRFHRYINSGLKKSDRVGRPGRVLNEDDLGMMLIDEYDAEPPLAKAAPVSVPNGYYYDPKVGRTFKHLPVGFDWRKDHAVVAKLAAGIKRWLGQTKLNLLRELRKRASKLGKAGSEEGDDEFQRIAQEIADALELGDAELVVELASAVIGEVAQDQVAATLGQLGLPDSSELFNTVDADMVEWARTRGAEMVGKRWVDGELVDSANAEMAIDETTRDMLRNLIADGLEEGKTLEQIADELENNEDYPLSEERAFVIASTEIANAASAGALRSAKQARDEDNVQSEKSWLVADEPCPICEENAAAGAIPLDDDFPSGDEAPTAHPSCVVGSTKVTPGGGIRAVSERYYRGPVYVLTTASQKQLTVTPNHPTLTRRGWVSSGELTERDELLCRLDAEGLSASITPYDRHMEPRIEQVAQAARRSRAMAPSKVEISTVDFHGDVLDDKVAQIWTNRDLMPVFDPARIKVVLENHFKRTLQTAASFLGLGPSLQLHDAYYPSTIGCVSVANLRTTLRQRHASPFDGFLFGLAAKAHSFPNEERSEGPAADAALAGQLVDGLAGPVAFEKIVRIDRLESFHGLVYNLETEQGYYLANGIVTHNCRCAVIFTAKLPGEGDDEDQPTTDEGDDGEDADPINKYMDVLGEALLGELRPDLIKFNPNHVPAGNPTGGQFATSDGSSSGEVPPIKFGALITPDLKPTTVQPYKTKEELYAHVAQAQKELQEWLDQGSGVISKMGGVVKTENPDHADTAFWKEPGTFLMVAHPKSEARAVEKTMGENGGHWDRLLDIVRASVAVDKVSDVQRVLDSLSASGMKLARLPKDRISAAVAGGWRGDVLLNPKLPGGVVAELQIGLKGMYAAKATGHDFYKEARTIKARYSGLPENDWPYTAKAEYQRLNDKMADFYANAWRAGAQEGMLKMSVNETGATYLEADNNYYRVVDGIVSTVLHDGQWVNPSPEGFAKAVTEGKLVSADKVARAQKAGW